MKVWVDRTRPVLNGSQDSSLDLLFKQQIEIYCMIQELRFLITGQPLPDDVPIVVSEPEDEQHVILESYATDNGKQ